MFDFLNSLGKDWIKTSLFFISIFHLFVKCCSTQVTDYTVAIIYILYYTQLH